MASCWKVGERVALVAALALVSAPALAQTAAPDLGPAVVKIHTTRRSPDFLQPWTKRPTEELSGSGVVLAGNRILTNAHVVMYAAQIYVQPYHSSDKLAAQVEILAPGIDLAVLTLDDESFFEGREAPPIEVALPRAKDPVAVYGYPMGGTELSITQGIVSRIEYDAYYGDTAGVRIQVDAALNPGNSGGPAFSNGRVIGLVFSGIREADNIGYLIPSEEIERFLADAADGAYDGIPTVLGSFVTLENQALRARLGAGSGVKGLVVHAPERIDDNPLERWDVVTHVGGNELSNDGMVVVPDGLRLDFRYYVPRLAQDGRVPMTIFRAGETLEVGVPAPRGPALVAPSLAGGYPRYFIYGPLVFSTATQEFIAGSFSAFGPAMAARKSPLLARWRDAPSFPGEELVVVTSRMFTHVITKGYDDPIFAVLATVDGAPVQNLAHLVELLRDGESRFVEFEFHDRGQETLVFVREEIEAATEDVLSDNGIRRECSDDLRELWNGGE